MFGIALGIANTLTMQPVKGYAGYGSSHTTLLLCDPKLEN